MPDEPPGSPTAPDAIPLNYASVPPPAKRRIGLAVSSMILGILGLVACAVFGLVGLILGIVALHNAQREPQQYGGKGMAIAGIITGGLGLVLVVVGFVFYFALAPPIWTRPGRLPKPTVDASNLRAIGQSCYVYANDNEGLFPLDLQMLIDGGMLAGNQLINPSSGNLEGACDYYFVLGLTDADPGDWIIAYSDPQFHNWEGANILYLDGRVEFVEEPRFTEEIDRFLAEFEEDRGAAPEVIGPK